MNLNQGMTQGNVDLYTFDHLKEWKNKIFEKVGDICVKAARGGQDKFQKFISEIKELSTALLLKIQNINGSDTRNDLQIMLNDTQTLQQVLTVAFRNINQLGTGNLAGQQTLNFGGLGQTNLPHDESKQETNGFTGQNIQQSTNLSPSSNLFSLQGLPQVNVPGHSQYNVQKYI